MPPYLDAPEGTTGACWRGTPLEIFRGRVFVPADAVPDLCAHGFLLSGHQEEDGEPELPFAAGDAAPPACPAGSTEAGPSSAGPDPAAMTKAELRAFLAERGQTPPSATGEDRLRAAVSALLAGE